MEVPRIPRDGTNSVGEHTSQGGKPQTILLFYVQTAFGVPGSLNGWLEMGHHPTIFKWIASVDLILCFWYDKTDTHSFKVGPGKPVINGYCNP